MDIHAFLDDFARLESKHGVRVTGITEMLDDHRRFYFGDFFISSEDKHQKPPLGLMPHGAWQWRRITEIMRAIVRYEDSRLAVPPEWIDELKLHVKEYS